MKYSKKALKRHSAAFEAAANRAERMADKEADGKNSGEHNYNPDPHYISTMMGDARRLRTIAGRIRKGAVASAKRLFWSHTNTAVREMVATVTYMWMWR